MKFFEREREKEERQYDKGAPALNIIDIIVEKKEYGLYPLNRKKEILMIDTIVECDNANVKCSGDFCFLDVTRFH